MNHAHSAVVLDLSANGIGIIRSLAEKGINVYAFDTKKPYKIGKSRLATCSICPSPLTEEKKLLNFLINLSKKLVQNLSYIQEQMTMCNSFPKIEMNC